MVIEQTGNPLHSKMISTGTWVIDGPVNDLMYLVTGSRRALLIDTGMGVGDLAGEVRRLTDLPVIVINTHGHPDHAGGNENFEEVWSPAMDEPIRQRMCSHAYRQADIRAILGADNPECPRLIERLVPDRSYRLLPLQPGQVFDLGERQLEVLAAPGHTPGSICLWNAAEGVLFAGDTVVSTPAWLYLDHCLPLQTYQRSLKTLNALGAALKTIYPGHQPTPIGPEHLENLLRCADEIMDGSAKGEPIRTFAGEGLLWKHSSAQIIYDPAKIF